MTKESIEALFQNITPYVVDLAGKLLVSVLVLVLGFKLVKLLTKLLSKSRAFSKLDPNVRSFFNSFLSIALKAVVIITVAGILGIPMASFITILGSMAVAIGLSLQGSLSNIAGGIILLLFKPFSIGEYISVDGVEGTVSEIGLYYTYLKTPDNQKVVIPNAVASNNTLVNVTHQTTRRVDLKFTVGYDSDIEVVKDILLGIADSHAKIIKNPEAPMARLSEHGDSALVFVLRCWCKSEDYWTVRFDLLEQVKVAFDKRGISIPYPQLDVHLDK
ncbi:MAG: mechanosensitive ion channel [Clostridia bacterium]|nr:mechanosensitive ion channel [Clostridia bacterium]